MAGQTFVRIRTIQIGASAKQPVSDGSIMSVALMQSIQILGCSGLNRRFYLDLVARGSPYVHQPSPIFQASNRHVVILFLLITYRTHLSFRVVVARIQESVFRQFRQYLSKRVV